MRDVIIIGGGISGLATAADLMARGLDVVVLERQSRAGGNAISERAGGYLIEHGPSTLNAAFSPAMTRIRDLGLDQSAIDLGPEVRNRYLRDGTALHGISTDPLGFFRSSYLSAGAKLSLLAEILRPRRTGTAEETIHAFATRRFGREFADKVIEPMAAGIFMGASRDLSISGAFPRLVEMEARHGSILRSILRKIMGAGITGRRGSDPGRRLFSWPQGIATLPRTLAADLAGRVSCGVTVTRLNRQGQGFCVTTARHGVLRARQVALAVQPHVAASLCEGLDPEGAQALAGIAAPPIRVVFLGYGAAQVAHPLDGLGFLSTLAPGQVISGAQFSSTMFGGRAPRDHVAISCYVGGGRRPDLCGIAESELVALVHGELSGLVGIRGAPAFVRTRLWSRGLPQYTLGHTARLSVLQATQRRVPGLHLVGNYLTGVSVTSCLEQAGLTARAVATACGAGMGQRGGVDAISGHLGKLRLS